MAITRRVFGGRVASEKRAATKAEFWPKEIAWTGHEEKGYFCGPRALPLILRAIREKSISGEKDASGVYLDLLSRHMGQGVVEIVDEDDHAFSAGYKTVRSWRDRMAILENAGFIRAVNVGNRQFGKVLIVHPSVAMTKLHQEKKITEELWRAYRTREISSGASAPGSSEVSLKAGA